MSDSLRVTEERITKLRGIANNIRENALRMALTAVERDAHIGGSFSCTEIVTALYFGVMRYNVKNPADANRDRFILSKTHAVLALYPVLHEAGFISEELLFNYRTNGSPIFGSPRNLRFGLEFEGGSLGMGLSYGLGQALAARIKGLDYRTFVLLGDGELHEGSNWEAFMAAAHFKLNNLVAVVDKNHLCIDGATEEVMALGDLAGKLSAFGWHVLQCDGHDFSELFRAFSDLSDNQPTVIIADTVKGKGVSFMEGKREWHHSRLTQEQFDEAMTELVEEEI